MLGVVLCFYPFCVYFGIQQFGPRVLGLILLLLFAVRYFTFKEKAGFFRGNLLPAASAVGVAFCIFSILADRVDSLKFYPVLSNVFLFILFATSLKQPPNIVERLARSRHPELTPRGVMHARQATLIWCGFFALNGCAALYTAFCSDIKTWTLYNGFVSYLIMGILFLIEFIVRRMRMAQDKREAATQ